MKLRHWAGYGTLNAKVLDKAKDLVIIEVWGNHEQGLSSRYHDTYRIEQWLGGIGRFKDRHVKNYETNEFSKRNEEKHVDEDHCIYTIHLMEEIEYFEDMIDGKEYGRGT